MDSGIPDRNNGSPTLVYNDESWRLGTSKCSPYEAKRNTGLRATNIPDYAAERLHPGYSFCLALGSDAERGTMGLQLFEQQEDFGGHGNVQIWGVGELWVAAAGDDGL